MKSLKEINNILQDHERRLAILEGKKRVDNTKKEQFWYEPGSTIEKIANLISENFFNEPRTIGDITSELKTKDFHLKASDLTLPLRKVVRKGLLRKTKKCADGTLSKKWLYAKVQL